jgi:hypothetical protein
VADFPSTHLSFKNLQLELNTGIPAGARAGNPPPNVREVKELMYG